MIFPRVFAAALAIVVVAIVASAAASAPAALAAGNASLFDLAALAAFGVWVAVKFLPLAWQAVAQGAAE